MPANDRVVRIVLPLTAYACALLIWTWAVSFSRTTIFPSPATTLRALERLSLDGVLWKHIGHSLGRIAAGYLTAVVIGVPIGLLMGRVWFVERLLNPVVQLLRPISPLAWIPVVVLWFGLSGAATIALIFVAALFPIVVTTAAAVRTVSAVHLRAGRNFGLSSSELLWRIIAPAALPRIFTGLRVALGVAWLVIVAAEMIAVDSGLGYLVIDARNAGKRYDLVVGTMLVIGVIGLGLDLLMRQCYRLRWLRWSVRRTERVSRIVRPQATPAAGIGEGVAS